MNCNFFFCATVDYLGFSSPGKYLTAIYYVPPFKEPLPKIGL